MLGILVLGGSGFMGRLLVDYFRAKNILVFTVNRGKTHWGTVSDPSGLADRNEGETYKTVVSGIVKSNPEIEWIGVIDFCAFSPRDVRKKTLPDVLFNSSVFPIYVFVSTDSVYEVVPGIELISDPISEEITGRFPKSKMVKKRDKYGFKKLMTERALFTRSPDSQSVVCLRLPDVIGEFDDTLRFWNYVKVIDSGKAISVGDEEQVVSFVYARDVVKVIHLLVKKARKRDIVVRESMNIACVEQKPMSYFLSLLSERIQPVRIGDGGKSFLPSVEYRKSPLSLEKMINSLAFTPTALGEAVEKTLAWFRALQRDHPHLLAE